MTATKRGRKPKYLHTLVLDGINARELYKRFKKNKKDDIQPITPILPYGTNSDNQTTMILDLSSKKHSTHMFLEPAEAKLITMLDHVKYGCLPDRTDLYCRHDGHPFNTSPIGIPIKYVPRIPEKDQPNNSEIIGTNDYYLTANIVCSWSCGLAFIEQHQFETLYKESKSLFYSMYYKIYKTELITKQAPKIDILRVHGGDLSIEEYRKRYCTHNYIITENIKRPYMVAVGKYIEYKRCGYT